MRTAVVVITFNRVNALRRLLQSIDDAFVEGEVDLIISVDGGAPEVLLEAVEKYQSKKYRVEVIKHSERLGLRRHVLFCGELSSRYESVVLLEDDLVVDKYFYKYANECAKFYAEDSNIAGLALYSPIYNECANQNFNPMRNGYDTYFSQVACSWGQLWTASQWNKFYDWYKINKDSIKWNAINIIPKDITYWPESSWKKYFQLYLALESKYIVYPYQSYSTNCSDPGGTHIKEGTSIFQTPLALPGRKEPIFNFCPKGEFDVVYDSFMDPVGTFIFSSLGLKEGEVAINLSGIKGQDFLERFEYVLAVGRRRDCVSGFPLSFRPIEYNLKYECEWDSIGISLFRWKDKGGDLGLIQRFSVKLYGINLRIFNQDFILGYIVFLFKRFLARFGRFSGGFVITLRNKFRSH